MFYFLANTHGKKVNLKAAVLKCSSRQLLLIFFQNEQKKLPLWFYRKVGNPGLAALFKN